MKKNFFKKIVTAVVTTAMAVSAIVAMPTEAKAATDKEIYLQVEEDDTYGIGLWNGYTGLTVNAEYMEGSDWIYQFTKVEDGLYKISVTTDGEVSLVGLQIYKGSKDGEIAKSDAQWSSDGGVFNTALQTELNTENTKVTISGYDSTNWNFSTVTSTTDTATDADTTTDNDTTAGDDTTTDTNTDTTTDTTTDTNTTTTPDTGDTAMVALYLAVAALAVVVVLKKQTVNN